MKILVGKTFGIGNAVLSIPMIKALSTFADVDVLVGSGPDDFGAVTIISSLKPVTIRNVWVDTAPLTIQYDVAIMAIPFDGRWTNGISFNAKHVMDCRKRPDNVERLGFDMWKKHEVEYQMENARELGYLGPTPSLSFYKAPSIVDEDSIYVGIGYKRDAGGFGISKHFGNERYANLLNEIKRLRPATKFVSTGAIVDMVQTAKYIYANVEDFTFSPFGLLRSIDVISRCGGYIGNDTGMMHIAASFNVPTCGLFAYPDLTVKNPPFCSRSMCKIFTDGSSVDEIASSFVEFVWGQQ